MILSPFLLSLCTPTAGSIGHPVFSAHDVDLHIFPTRFDSMQLIDTHTHFYDEIFSADRESLVAAAKAVGVEALILPNINQASTEPLLSLQAAYPGYCFATTGLHPTDVTPDYGQTLARMEQQLGQCPFVAIGETGLDFYWDTTYSQEQERSLEIQIDWAIGLNLPIILHCRKAFDPLYRMIKQKQKGNLTGVFHCFPGDEAQARKVIDLGFYLGIGGVVTYKNATMAKVVSAVGPNHLVLETDAPWLPPIPHRGQRNQSDYLPLIAQKVAELLNTTPDEIGRITTANARSLFQLHDS